MSEIKLREDSSTWIHVYGKDSKFLPFQANGRDECQAMLPTRPPPPGPPSTPPHTHSLSTHSHMLEHPVG